MASENTFEITVNSQGTGFGLALQFFAPPTLTGKALDCARLLVVRRLQAAMGEALIDAENVARHEEIKHA